jgi:ferric-dicitrate binding protein FerR (iron transport regulator)
VLIAATILLVLPRLNLESPIVAKVDRVVGEGAVVVERESAVPLQPAASVHVDQLLRTAPNVRMALQLGPHLEVRMDEESQAKFAAADRIVLYRGALYVDASSAQSPPLSIETPYGKVQHVGTQYDTRVDDRSLRIRVRTGAVVLVRDAQVTTAQGGEQLRVSASGVRREPTAVSGADWKWVAQVAARFDIENHSLAEFLEWTGRETGYEIVYASDRVQDAARQVILHGSVAGLTPELALAAVLSTTRFTYSQVANRITIALRP